MLDWEGELPNFLLKNQVQTWGMVQMEWLYLLMEIYLLWRVVLTTKVPWIFIIALKKMAFGPTQRLWGFLLTAMNDQSLLLGTIKPFIFHQMDMEVLVD